MTDFVKDSQKDSQQEIQKGPARGQGDLPVRVALVGAGVFAQDVHLPSLLRLSERFQVVAVYSRTRAAAEALAGQAPYPVEATDDLAGLLARTDIDAVDILLPIPVMPDVVEQALATGKHVISEKPVAPTVAEGRRLLALARRRPHQIWMVGENWRYEQAFQLAAAAVRRGDIGRPLTCSWMVYTAITHKNKYYHTPWRRSSSFPGGFLLDGGVHHMAALRMVLGEVETVTAEKCQASLDLPPADTISATLRFANGVLGSYLASYAAPAPWPPALHVVGDSGSLRVQRGSLELTYNGQTRVEECSGFDGAQRELAAFAEAVQQGAPHLNSPEEALRDLAVVEALLAAAESGRRTAVELIE